MLIGFDDYFRTPTLTYGRICIALQHPALLLKTLSGQPTPGYDISPELRTVLNSLTAEERAELRTWCEAQR